MCRAYSEGLIYEADSRHIDLLSDAFSLQKSSGVLTPGLKLPDADGEAAKSEDGPCQDMGQATSQDTAQGAGETARPHRTAGNTRLVKCVIPDSVACTEDVAKIAEVEPNHSQAPQLGHASTVTTSISTSSDICCALRDAVVSLSDDPIVVYDVPCYAEVYGCHPSRLLATSRGSIQSKSYVDRFCGKNAAVMDNKRKTINVVDGTNKVTSHT